MSDPRKYITTSITLDPDLHQRSVKQANREGASWAEMVRAALTERADTGDKAVEQEKEKVQV